MAGYGVVKEGTTIKIGDMELSFTRNSNVLEYVRKSDKGEVKRRLIYGKPRIILQPTYPVFYPEYPRRITNYILIKLLDEVDVEPSSTIEFHIHIPVDLAVIEESKNTYSFLDVIPLTKVKYTLYGSVVDGVIARYYESKVYIENLEYTGEPGLALAKVRVINKSHEWVKITRILVDSIALKLYYRENTWEAYIRLVELTTTTPRAGVVSYGKCFEENVREALDPPELKVPLIQPKTLMPWGF